MHLDERVLPQSECFAPLASINLRDMEKEYSRADNC